MRNKRGELRAEVKVRSSQSLRSTARGRWEARASRGCLEGVDSKAMLREGRQEGGSGRCVLRQSESEASPVPETATQGAGAQGRDWSWVEASVWTERMLAALENGVRGGKWLALCGGA